MVSDTTVEYSCPGKVHQAVFGISLCVPGQAVRRGKLLPGERDILRVLLGKVVLAVPELGGSSSSMCVQWQQPHRHPLTMNSAEHVEIYIGAKGSHPLGRYLHNLAALSPGVK